MKSPLGPLAASLFTLSALTAPTISAADYEWKRTEHSIALTKGETVIWQHNHNPDIGKPFFHPLSTVQGTPLTGYRPRDHVWHRAGWWSWKMINGLNYWEENGKTQRSQGRTQIQSTEFETHDDFSATVKLKVHYHPPEKDPVLAEERTIKVSAPDKDGNYHLDWTFTFTALTELKIDRTPIQGQKGGKPWGGYAGLSIRAAMDHKRWDFMDSEGRRGLQGHGKTSRWVAHMGMTKSKEEAATVIIDHPENRDTPTKWYLNKGMPYYSPAFIFTKGFEMKKDETLSLRYRMLIQSKQTGPTGIEKAYTDFTGIKVASKIPDLPVRDIELGTQKMKMRFQIESFAVRPGSPVRVSLTNTDDMPHNVLFTGGNNKVAMGIAQKAWAMGANGPANAWVPNDHNILGASGLVEPGESDVFKFYAPTKPGDYTYICSFPGHSYTMKGIMRVTDDPLADNFIKAPEPFGAEHVVFVEDKPVIRRFNMQTVSAPTKLSTRGIAVGLPAGTHYIFDPGYGGVRLAWFGAFLDLTGERTDRGRGKNTLIGDIARVGDVEFPLRVGDPKKKPVFDFKGYQHKGTKPPAFIYEIDGVRFAHRVSFNEKKQMVHTFSSKADKPVFFTVDKNQLAKAESSAGTWNKGTLSLSPEEARSFTVTLTLKGI